VDEEEVQVTELSEEEGSRIFDATCRREMGISSEEFLRRWDAGEWEGQDLDDTPGLVDAWMVMPRPPEEAAEWPR